MKYLNEDGALIQEGHWLNPNGINEWDEAGDNPLTITAVRVEAMECHFDAEGVCINIGDLDSDTEVSEVKTLDVETHPSFGRRIK